VEANYIIVAVVIGLAVAIVAVPYIWGLLALWLNPTSAKGSYQKKAVTKLLTIKDSLETAGHPEASRLCRDSIISLICDGDDSPAPATTNTKKSLFQQ
jgi:hypothetical protein